ncbi:hypothetical protein [Alicyclobacillus mengziensis]|uniref:Uncharacterized protein n=1 Tax=Alicyclobacillus mengziensis TaxID=2931921 RepID=A0A9X7W1U3_9BACL|nr:hypothetical protein [Alicyclobacillus mengziensis]QSO49181.1 hypothetical protein JZ786_09810 [Alicyclobacillus mengziensis]
MDGQLDEVVYLMYEPKSGDCKPTAYRVTTTEGLQEIAELVKTGTGHVYFISYEEFLGSNGLYRLTDSIFDSIGAAEGSVFYIWLGVNDSMTLQVQPKYAILTPVATPRLKNAFKITTISGVLEVVELAKQPQHDVRFVDFREFSHQVSRGRWQAHYIGHLCAVLSDCEEDGLAEQWVDGSAFRYIEDVRGWMIRPANYVHRRRRKR